MRHRRQAIIMFTVLAAFWAADLVCMQARNLNAAGLPLATTLQKAPEILYRDPLRLSLDRTDMLAGLAGAAAVGFAWLYKWIDRKNYRDREEYGSAEWGKGRDIEPYCDPEPAENLQMTATEALSLDVNATRRNLNVAVIGGSGSGKTRGYVRPNLLRMNMNYAVTDPKGEIYRSCARRLEERGYTVHKLDLVDLAAGDRFNPMAYINPDKPEESIMLLSDNLIRNTDERQNAGGGGDQFWTKAEKALYNALLTFVYYTTDHPSMPAMIDMVAAMQASEEDEQAMSIVDARMAASRDMIREVRAHPDEWDDQVHRIVDGLDFSTAQYRTFEQGAGETKKSIIISAGVRLAPMQVAGVRALLGGLDGTDTIGLDEFCKPGRTALFLVLPDTNRTFNFLAAILYQMLFEHTIYAADHDPEGHLQVPLHCFLDEFANIGQIPNFEQLIGTIRGRWISVSVILQDLAQIKARYKDNWETIVGNCDSILCLGVGKGDETTPKWLSGLLGKETIDLRDNNVTKGSHGSFTINNRRTGRELLTPDEIGKLPDDRCIYLLRGIRPFLSAKTDPERPVTSPRSSLRHTPGWRPMSQAGVPAGEPGIRTRWGRHRP